MGARRWGGVGRNRHVRRHEWLLLVLMLTTTAFGAVFYAYGGVVGAITIVMADVVSWYVAVRERTGR